MCSSKIDFPGVSRETALESYIRYIYIYGAYWPILTYQSQTLHGTVIFADQARGGWSRGQLIGSPDCQSHSSCLGIWFNPDTGIHGVSGQYAYCFFQTAQPFVHRFDHLRREWNAARSMIGTQQEFRVQSIRRHERVDVSGTPGGSWGGGVEKMSWTPSKESVLASASS